ncbi:MAG: malto-oligosyltrehalose synthase [Mycobacteriales bacterium]
MGSANRQVRTPDATYRTQLWREFGYAEAAGLADYLEALGVSHLYSSPQLRAVPGSTHLYDVVDPTGASDDLGGEAGRVALAGRLRELGLGLVLDIVPNHLGVAVPADNPWWWDVLAHGEESAYARYFDIDWAWVRANGGRLPLPVLGDDDPEPVLEADGRVLRFGDGPGALRLPVAPDTGGGTAREVLARQRYRPVCWRRVGTDLAYRRFFDVTGLAGMRMEDPEVYAATHDEVLRWVAAGDVAGLRVDHVDGLADPAGYLDRLDRSTRAAGPVWLVVEKVLHPGEELPDWPCAGTTGYEALREVCGLFVDPAGEEPLTALWTGTGGAADFAELAHAAKVEVATGLLRPELARLARLAPDLPADDAVAALAEVAACLPVYRTYLPYGAELLAGALAAARGRRPELAGTLDRLAGRLADPADPLAVRFQQTSGMVMAKGVEDTAYYRYHRLVALNEVGGDPTRFGVSPAEFHASCADRRARRPATMTALSTHDTKRGEDVRARLAVLSELPTAWADAVHRWNDRRTPPDPDLAHLAWQTLVGAWPLPPDRFTAYLLKAVHEAKTHTSWTDPDPAYEKAVAEFATGVYDDSALREEIGALAARLAPYGWSNGLGQKLVQLTMPGVPDVYQGSELWDLSLVDPDNRRPVDFAARRRMLAALDRAAEPAAVPAVDATGAAKMLVTARALRLRRDRPKVFAGDYEPLAATGPAAAHAVAFARSPGQAGEVVTVATRLPVGLERAGGWRGTTLALPGGNRRWRDVLTGREHGTEPAVADVLASLPVALLVRDG